MSVAEAPVAETVYSEEARLPELLDRVEQGEEVMIARHGALVAKLVPFQAKPPGRDEQAIADALQRLDDLSRRMSLGGLKIKDLINEGRR